MTAPNVIPRITLDGKLFNPKAAEAPNITTKKEKVNEINLLNLVLKNGFSKFFHMISLGGGASKNEI